MRLLRTDNVSTLYVDSQSTGYSKHIVSPDLSQQLDQSRDLLRNPRFLVFIYRLLYTGDVCNRVYNDVDIIEGSS